MKIVIKVLMAISLVMFVTIATWAMDGHIWFVVVASFVAICWIGWAMYLYRCYYLPESVTTEHGAECDCDLCREAGRWYTKTTGKNPEGW